MTSLSIFLFCILTCSTFGLTAYAIRHKKTVQRTAPHIAPLIGIMAFGAVYELIGTVFLYLETSPWFRIYTVLESAGVFYYFQRLHRGKYRPMMYFFAAAGILVAFTVTWQWDSIAHADGDAYISLVETVFVMVASLLWFRDMFNDLSSISLTQNPDYYFVSGILIYVLGTITLFVYNTSLIAMGHAMEYQFWTINTFMASIFRILLWVGLWKAVHRPEEKAHQ